jgi:hypothetical protein
MATTGLLRAAPRAADMNLRPPEISSNCTRIDWVSRSTASQSSTSARSTSILAPRCSTVEKPMPRLPARSSTAAVMAVDWVIRATFPGMIETGAALALRPRAGTTRPPLPGPRMRIMYGRAASRMALRAAAISLLLILCHSQGPTITPRVPRAPSCLMIDGTISSVAQTIARSGTTTNSSRRTSAPMPNSERFLAPTETTGPANPPATRLAMTTSA